MRLYGRYLLCWVALYTLFSALLNLLLPCLIFGSLHSF